MDKKDQERIAEKKKYLKRYLKIQKKIESLREKLIEEETRMTSPKIQHLSHMPRGGTPKTIADVIAAKEETVERINCLINKQKQIRKEIITKLDELEDHRHVEVLELFFIEGHTLEEIADIKMHNVRHIIRLYSQGIEELKLDREPDSINVAQT